MRDLDKNQSTKSLRLLLVKNITVRFGILMCNDFYRQAAFLDPKYGPGIFDSYDRNAIIDTLKEFIDANKYNQSKIYNKNHIDSNEQNKQTFDSNF